ncbi:MAG: 4-hydroxybutyrate-CoA transferase/hydrolase [Xanthobacteraceae bacterium]|nr:MAG: 4-hydroxybutyrate-CoA transferase/hydrolase [Xanthobacteraceae bacterium]
MLCGQCAAEPLTLTRALVGAAAQIGDVEVFLGANFSRTFSRTSPPNLRFASYGALGTSMDLSRAGRLEVSQMHYSALHAAFAEGALKADVVFLQLREGPRGLSLGLANDYSALAARHARVVIAEVNAGVPVTTGADLPADIRIAAFVEAAMPPLDVPPAALGHVSEQIGRRLAELVPDGATIQIGVGAIPDAVLAALTSHRDLGLHSGVMTDRVLDLIEAGAMTDARKTRNPGAAVTNTLIGTRRLYDYADGNPHLMVMPASETHDHCVLRSIDRFFSINSGIEVDLAGRVNAERAGGQQVGGLGGIADFTRGARASKGGASIIALPATADGGRISRIVARVEAATIGPGDVDFVVTEFGVADLRLASVRERAGRLTAIAHPDFRDGLERAACGGGPG